MRHGWVVLMVVSLLAGADAVQAPPVRGAAPRALPRLKLVPVADIAAPTATAIRDGDDTLYVSAQAGQVRAIRDGKLVAQPVLDLTGLVVSGGERGLLGIAFAPDGSELYVHYSDRQGDTQIDAYTMRDGVAVPSTRRAILNVRQPQTNHNGGQLAFGPDGLLYIGLGDGGAANDEGTGHAPGGNGQSLATLLGKILRIDPRGTGNGYTVPTDNPFAGREGARSEIWAYGLRNPWRFSFDPKNGDLWIADVGQNEWEEIDHARANGGRNAGRGANYGWNRLEGTHAFRGDAPNGAVAPVFELSHDDGACSVTGGMVYRGRIAKLRGWYVFSDYCDGTIRALKAGAKQPYRAQSLRVEGDQIVSFGVDSSGELSVLSQSGGVLRLARA